GKGDWDFNEHLRVGDRRNWLKKDEAFYDYAQPNGDTININGQDLNTIQKTGLYGGNNLGNSPDGTTAFFYVEVVRYSDRNYV
ncbi:hypothetical protein CN630_34275, partial [Bacillus wiedmannii]